jgi:predicted permease
MSIPILAGRGFGTEDTETSRPVAVVNQALVKEFFPNTNPIGKRFRMETDGPEAARWIEIVGVCGDTRYNTMKDAPPPIFFNLYRQAPVTGPQVGSVTYLIRSSLPGGDLLPSIRRVVAGIDPELPVTNVRTQRQMIERSMTTERMFASLSAGFGALALALALACVGIYGVMGYSVANRTNEIGIRLALGALPRQVLAMILREATWVSLAGVVVGLGAALMLARLVRSMLYGLQPADPVSLISGAVLLMGIGLAASWIPARRAASVEPMEALRHE